MTLPARDPKGRPAAVQTVEMPQADEVTPLLLDHHGQAYNGESSSGTTTLDGGEANSQRQSASSSPVESQSSPWGTLTTLFIGIFISQADQTLVLATYSTIASEFQELNAGFWIVSAHVLAQCVAQPLYGKLSDIYGRKACLQAAYFMFLLGTIGTGLGWNMASVIAGRAFQGLGAAGMVCMVSILITDLVPMHEVASLRSYVNVVQTLGRASGGAIGGFLTQAMGWRWAFLVQVPFAVASIVLVYFKVNIRPRARQNDMSDRESYAGAQATTKKSSSHWAKLRRVDFPGAISMSLTILGTCLVLDLRSNKLPWSAPEIIGIAVGTFFAAVLFVLSSRYLAKEPIFPLHLLTHFVVVTSYGLLLLQNTMTMTMMMVIPMYFQVTARSSVAAAGAYLIPSFFGNTIGALWTGWFIKRTGLYKLPTILSAVSNIACYVLLLLLWNGHTPPWQSLFVFFGGLATGISHSSVFVGLTSGVDEGDIAIAGSGLYLSGSMGAVIGSALSSSLYEATLESQLRMVLDGMPNMEEIIEGALSNIEYIQRQSAEIRAKMMPAYITSFRAEFWLCIACGVVSLLLALTSRERRLKQF